MRNAFNGPQRLISTRTELERLLAARPKPTVEQHLTPGGSLEANVRQSVHAAAERRIGELRDRLDRAKAGFGRDHVLGQVRDRARTDFGRSR